MTRHLRDDEFVDLLDHALAGARRAHVEGCAECRQKAETLRLTLAAVDGDVVPEPSPLFWDQLSARIRRAVAEEPRPAAGWRRLLAGVPARWAAAAAIGAVVLPVALWQRPWRTDPVPPPGSGAASEQADAFPGPADLRFDEIDADEAWAVVRTMADELGEEDLTAAGIGSAAGGVELAANALSDAERARLAELIAREIAGLRPGPAS